MYVAFKLRAALHRLALTRTVPLIRASREFSIVFDTTIRTYKFKAYPGRITIFSPDPWLASHADDNARWATLARGVEFIPTSGNHVTMFQQCDKTGLSEVLLRHIRAAIAADSGTYGNRDIGMKSEVRQSGCHLLPVGPLRAETRACRSHCGVRRVRACRTRNNKRGLLRRDKSRTTLSQRRITMLCTKCASYIKSDTAAGRTYTGVWTVCPGRSIWRRRNTSCTGYPSSAISNTEQCWSLSAGQPADLSFWPILLQHYPADVDWSKVTVVNLEEYVAPDRRVGLSARVRGVINPLVMQGIRTENVRLLDGHATCRTAELLSHRTFINDRGGIDIALLGLKPGGGISGFDLFRRGTLTVSRCICAAKQILVIATGRDTRWISSRLVPLLCSVSTQIPAVLPRAVAAKVTVLADRDVLRANRAGAALINDVVPVTEMNADTGSWTGRSVIREVHDGIDAELLVRFSGRTMRIARVNERAIAEDITDGVRRRVITGELQTVRSTLAGLGPSSAGTGDEQLLPEAAELAKLALSTLESNALWASRFVARNDNEVRAETGVSRRWELRQFQILCKWVDSSTTRILDAPCGSGRFALAMGEAYPDAHVTGIDLLPQAITLACRGSIVHGVPNVHFCQMDAFAMADTFDRRPFDFAYSVGLLQNLTPADTRQFLRNLPTSFVPAVLSPCPFRMDTVRCTGSGKAWWVAIFDIDLGWNVTSGGRRWWKYLEIWVCTPSARKVAIRFTACERCILLCLPQVNLFLSGGPGMRKTLASGSIDSLSTPSTASPTSGCPE